jgi:hypothetical protein
LPDDEKQDRATSFFKKKMKDKYLFLFTLWFILLVSCSKDGGLELLPANRTVIVYMAADNDLSEDAYDNLREIQSGYEEKGANLIVFIDPADDVPHILKIILGGNQRIKVYPEFNSADTGQMRQVLNDIICMYPAESYGLILWSHGSSWLPADVRLRSFGEDNGRQMNISLFLTEYLIIQAIIFSANTHILLKNAKLQQYFCRKNLAVHF